MSQVHVTDEDTYGQTETPH